MVTLSRSLCQDDSNNVLFWLFELNRFVIINLILIIINIILRLFLIYIQDRYYYLFVSPLLNIFHQFIIYFYNMFANFIHFRYYCLSEIYYYYYSCISLEICIYIFDYFSMYYIILNIIIWILLYNIILLIHY